MLKEINIISSFSFRDVCMLRRISLPVQLVAVILFVFTIGSYIPLPLLKTCYTFSLLFKELLNFTLPFIIFSFVLTGILSFRKNAPLILMILMAIIVVSNAFVAFTSYAVARMTLSSVACEVDSASLAVSRVLEPYYFPYLPPMIRSEYMLIIALVLGVVGTFIRVPKFEFALHRMKRFIELVVNSLFIPLLPFYVFGFLLKIQYEGTMGTLFGNYGPTVLLIICVQLLYLLWFYLLSAGFNINMAVNYIKTAIPTYLTAFSTMSSAATIPVAVEAATKNTGNEDLSTMAIPIMANIHLLGDSIVTSLLALVTLLIFKSCIPTFAAYMTFVFYFCTAMFAVSGIPGGGILVMLPILKTQLGFTAEMQTVITALYFLLDSFGTAANVMGDGALIIIFNKVLRKFNLAE